MKTRQEPENGEFYNIVELISHMEEDLEAIKEKFSGHPTLNGILNGFTNPYARLHSITVVVSDAEIGERTISWTSEDGRATKKASE